MPGIPAPSASWPFPELGLQVAMAEAVFEHRISEPGDFAAAGIPMPEDLVEAVPMRRAAHLAGRVCAREALRAAGAGESLVGRDRSGAPVWPAGFRGSITHAGRTAAAAAIRAAACRGIGLDYEIVMTGAAAEEISDLVLRPADRRGIASLAGTSFEEGATLVFSLKESLYKAISPSLGGFTGFEDAELAWIGGGRARLRLVRRLSDALPDGTEMDCVYALSGDLVRTLAVFA
ncbi:4'-phosphopantetheinyl transferase family protein [Nisaea sediminum]|uniref:4'-phosphopantetheinyl transferase family protein n=1 Tax=Nisaea sediminum TaxID=2775867 RepID=UPI0018684C95|nr:4'-phosphopantetheinyl transferase superfamily protein [Nisaea sediminum]